jgi:hypothetical protein
MATDSWPANQPAPRDSARVAVTGGCLVRQHRATLPILIACIATGTFWSNIRLGRLLGFPVTPSILLTALFYGIAALHWLKWPLRVSRGMFLPPLSLLVYEFLLHGVLDRGVYEREWLQSFALLVMCIGLLILSSRMRPCACQQMALIRAVGHLACGMGILGMGQFILNNVRGHPWFPLPAVLTMRDLDQVLLTDAHRFGGILRATGFASEPSRYGVTMVVLAALCLMLLGSISANRRTQRLLRRGLVFSILGTLISLSFAAWGVLGMVLLAYVVSKIKWNMPRRYVRLILAMLALLVIALVALWPFVAARWQRLQSGADRSAIVRLAPVELIVKPGHNLVTSLFGVGIGLERQSPRVQQVYGDLESQFDQLASTNINNGLSVIAVTMGWVGLALQAWVILAPFLRGAKMPMSVLPILALLVGYFFATGHYLLPEWWALLSLACLLQTHRATDLAASDSALAGTNASSRHLAGGIS